MFINNEDKVLGERLRELAQHAKELHFLVGFFYFSGFKEIFEGIKNNPSSQLKVLVGLDIDKFNHQVIEYAKKYPESILDSQIIEQFTQNFSKAFNNEEFDTKDFYEQAKFFIEIFESNRLELKKTREPNHSKLYLFNGFYNPINIIDSVAILGSSNFTASGLFKQNELNVEIRDVHTIEKLNQYFQEQWNNAIDLNKPELKKVIIEAVENNSPIKSITPFEAYIYLAYLYQQLSVDPKEEYSLKKFLESKGYKPLQYQLDSVSQAVKMLEIHNGVILADVVGLGKSIIASLIAHQLNCKGIIICPPGLIGDTTLKTSGWAKYVDDFELYGWEIFSSGKLEEALERSNNGDFKAVIIDEAHRFRNPNTESYAYLHSICRNKKVILLSATPFNNNPKDVFAFLKLFTIPKKSTLTLNGNLDIQVYSIQKSFEKCLDITKNYQSDDPSKRAFALKKYNEMFKSKVNLLEEEHIDNVRKKLQLIAHQIRQIIEPVVIRRNRLDLKEDKVYQKEIAHLPNLNKPIECYYELNWEQNQFYDHIIRKYFSENGLFKGPIYRPKHYAKDEPSDLVYQFNLYNFMRRLLVKRFESSWYSFHKSIQNFIQIYQNAKAFIEQFHYFVLNRKKMNEMMEIDLSNLSDEEINQIFEELIKVYHQNHQKDEIFQLESLNETFVLDIDKDLELLKKINEEVTQFYHSENDPKVLKLKEILDNIIGNNQKAIIFSEFTDTVNYLYESLKQTYKILVVTQSPNKEVYKKILSNFDPSSKETSNEYDILLVTDRFSEGYNLNRANHIINFDIPWNPVRVIQRVGRINRIGYSPYSELFLYNFFPTLKGESEINLRKIAEEKMFMIHQCFGEDSQILSEDEQPSPSKLFEKINQNPDEINEKTHFITKIRNLLNDNPEIVNKIKYLPNHIKIAKKFNDNQTTLAVKRSNILYFFTYPNDNSQNLALNFEDVHDFVKCNFDEPALKLSDNFWKHYEFLKSNYKKFLDQNSSSLFNDFQNKQKGNNEKAISIIFELLRKNPQALSEHKVFLENILSDLNYFGTLPSSFIQSITNWKFNELEKIVDELIHFKKILGDNFLTPIEEKSKLIKTEVIICIENQKF